MMMKRKHTALPLSVKLDALKRMDRGESSKQIAKELGVSTVTVGDWKRNRVKLENWHAEGASTSRMRMKESEYEKTSEALFLWFATQRSKGCPVTGPMLQEKALQFRNQLREGDENFAASFGWLEKWKKRYGIRHLKPTNELLPGENISCEVFVAIVNNIIEEGDYSPDQLYVCHETVLNYKLLPEKQLEDGNALSNRWDKESKERVTMLPCSNASGDHRMPLLIVGKHKNQVGNSSELSPVLYKYQRNSWLDRNIFKEWFHDDFVPEIEKTLKEKKLPIKALLLIDSDPSHRNEEELVSGGIRTLFLPPNLTSLIYPMEQGVVVSLRRKYRLKLLTHMVGEPDIKQYLSNLSFTDIVRWLAEMWEEMDSNSLLKSWEKIIPKNNDEEFTDIYTACENKVLLNLLREIPGYEEGIGLEGVEKWMTADDSIEVLDEDIIEMVHNKEVVITDKSGQNVTKKPVKKEKPKMSHAEGFAVLEKALNYVEQQPEATPEDILFLKRWAQIAQAKKPLK